jgi:hypothetical protein
VTRRNWAERKSMTARRWLKFMVLLSIAVRARRISLGAFGRNVPRMDNIIINSFQ